MKRRKFINISSVECDDLLDLVAALRSAAVGARAFSRIDKKQAFQVLEIARLIELRAHRESWWLRAFDYWRVS